MQSSDLLKLKLAARQFICVLCFFVCIAGPVFACIDNRTGDQLQSAVASVTQAADECYETADCKSASQFVRWNAKPAFLSRSLVIVLQQRGLCLVTHPAGNLCREFSQPSLLAMGIALRL